jgi:hypothetical protein
MRAPDAKKEIAHHKNNQCQRRQRQDARLKKTTHGEGHESENGHPIDQPQLFSERGSNGHINGVA